MFVHGAFALEQGFIFSAMIWSTITVYVIERSFVKAGLWALAGAGLSGVGLMHSYRFTLSDTVLDLSPAWPWATAYAVVGVTMLLARWLTRAVDGNDADTRE